MSKDRMAFYYEALMEIHSVMLDGVTAFFLYVMVKGFLGKRRYAVFAGAAYFSVITLMAYIPVYVSNFTAYGLAVFAAFLVMWLCERERRRQKLFLAVTFFSLRWMATAVANCTENIIYRSFPVLLYSLNNEWTTFLRTAAVMFLNLGQDVLLMFAAVWVIRKFYLYKRAEMTGKELLMLSTPSLSGMVGYHMLKLYEVIYTNDTGKSLLDIYRPYHWLFLLYYAFSFASVLAMIVLFQKIKKGQEEKWQGEFLLGQMEDIKKHIAILEKRYRDIQGMKHDMGNHIMTLERLYTGKEYGEAKRYTGQLMEELRGAEPGIRSGNPVTDVILMEKREEAEKKGMVFTCDFHYPEGMGINAFDLSIILNNALNNAMEHTVSIGKPFIHVESYRRGNIYMMEFRNRMDGSVDMDTESGLPVTAKPDGTGHGFGLFNIRKVAQKYKGELDIGVENSIFRLSVMLLGTGEE